MLDLSINRINLTSPYKVENSGESSFVFVTDHGVKYEISFVIDYTLNIANSYQLCIDNVENRTQPRDIKVRDTIVEIIKEFFNSNEVSLLYICDTSDGRQKVRDRIFRMWFEETADRELYTIIPASIEVDGEEYFASLILRNNHPQYEAISSAFIKFKEDLMDKWNN